MPVQEQVKPLAVAASQDALRQELGIIDPTKVTTGLEEHVDPELQAQAKSYAAQLLDISKGDLEGEVKAKTSIEEMGRKLQKDAANRSKLLDQPIRNLYKSGAEGSEVATTLSDLRNTVEDLDPFSFTEGWGTRALGMIPGVGTPLQRYFRRYESAQTQIDAIVNSLERGREQLARDITTMTVDQVVMRQLTQKLQKTVKLGQLIDKELEAGLAEVNPEEERYKFIQEQLLFPLRQRIQDIQQQLIVNQQGVLAYEVIIRNNRELIRGVHRAHDVTITALRVAVSVASALANQKIVLDKITALNTTTSMMIDKTAQHLRTQGAEINKMASSTMLDMNALKSAFTNIKATMDEISRFRREALPQMAAAILEMDKMSFEQEEEIGKMERGNKMRGAINIEVKD